jgi:quinol monooxygenase YgiN
MLRRAFWALAIVVSLAMPVAVHAQGGYLDVYRVKVKPEKYADFQALTKKWVEANRQNGGDRWLAAETVYGEGGVVQFTSTRSNYADIDKANEVVMAAVGKAFGKDAEKVMQDFSSCLASERSELRRRRGDLSRKAPTDAAAYAKLIGSSRFLRTTAVHVRSGHIAEFEALLKDLKAAAEKNPNTQPVFVSQVIEGTKGTTFYVSTLRSSLAGFDNNPTTHDILGDEGYKKFLQVNADAVEIAESSLLRFSPELSNPPDDVAAAAPDFWHPKPKQ